MRYLVCLLSTLICLSASLLSFVEDQADEKFLPIGLTDEEKLMLDQIGKSHRGTPPPVGEIRNPSEWEPSEGVIIRWPLGISISLVAALSQDVMVTTIVASSSQDGAWLPLKHPKERR